MDRVLAALLVALLGAAIALIGVVNDTQAAKAIGGLAVIGGVLYALAYLGHALAGRRTDR